MHLNLLAIFTILGGVSAIKIPSNVNPRTSATGDLNCVERVYPRGKGQASVENRFKSKDSDVDYVIKNTPGTFASDKPFEGSALVTGEDNIARTMTVSFKFVPSGESGKYDLIVNWVKTAVSPRTTNCKQQN